MPDASTNVSEKSASLEADPRSAPSSPATLEPMDPQLTSIQPGGGIVMRIELAWGHLRRAYLKTFRRGYVERMRHTRQGTHNGCPHEVLDPRDLKFHRNQPGYWWDEADDPFAYRDRLPFVRDGLAELLLFSLLTFVPAAMLAWLGWGLELPGAWSWLCRLASVALAVIGALIVWFFRNPRRKIPAEPGLVVSPADGKVVAVEELEYDPFIGGPAVLVGIFLSIFNVHVNRMPVAGRVVGLSYRRGKFLNALRPESARENEQLAVRIESTELPARRMIVRQIAGAIARRIVCRLKPGDVLPRGELFGMIKLGSRTELVLPRQDGLRLCVQPGQNVRAGTSVIAAYAARSGDGTGGSRRDD